MGDKDVDAQFADIVARWDDVPSLPDAPDSPSDGVSDDRIGMPRGAADEDASPSVRGTGVDDSVVDDIDRSGPSAMSPGVNPPLEPSSNPTNPPPVRPFVVWRGAEQDPEDEDHTPPELVDLPVDDDEHFQPGPLQPLPPQEDLQFWGIIVGLVGGPLLLLWLVLFRPNVSDWWTLGALLLTIGGFVLLVMRQPHSRDEDDPDNGARV
ncbi:hypothetical protein [Knoellia koreensis]|uniref:DUF308 domain-containing protein n=1 Tax=Knoellia koreensis TaxID=2730921 RepID=A0A849HG67_9MICO|nr:hypothetical protein [Knoellia sp. DB2414S]NNM45241.1 hypothetical protein [Knoellia sp. DB2414S]